MQTHAVAPVFPLLSEPTGQAVQLSGCVPPLAALYVFMGQGTVSPAESLPHPQKYHPGLAVFTQFVHTPVEAPPHPLAYCPWAQLLPQVNDCPGELRPHPVACPHAVHVPEVVLPHPLA